MKQIFRVFAKELSLYNGRPMLWLAAITIAFLPALYTVIYLGAVWDPYEKLDQLPAGLVVSDVGTQYQGKTYNLGNRLAEELTQKDPFKFISYKSESEVKEAVRSGAIFFALIVPEDFTRKALPGHEVGELKLVTSQGMSFIAGLMAKRFAGEAVKQLNDQIAVERWRAVLSSAKYAREAVYQLRSGSGEALEGSQKLTEGLKRAEEGSGEITLNQKKLADGLQNIPTKELVEKGEELHTSTAKLADGLAGHILSGALLRIPFGLPSDKDLTRLSKGATMYQGRIIELGIGLDKAAEGARTLAVKDEELTQGLGRLEEGSVKLTAGLDKIHEGLELFASSMPKDEKKAEDLAVPVTWHQEDLAPIRSNGQGFAPYFMSLSLWLGVVVSSFLFRLRIFPYVFMETGKVAKVIGKGLAPLSITLTSAVILGVIVQFFMKVSILHAVGFYTALLVSTFAYSTIVLALVRLVGDAGKLISVIFLVVQIAASGGAYPIQLSPQIYQVISPYLPLTFTVEALRASMFGCYNADWPKFLLYLLPWMIVSLILSLLSTRQFKYVDENDYGPALDLSKN